LLNYGKNPFRDKGARVKSPDTPERHSPPGLMPTASRSHKHSAVANFRFHGFKTIALARPGNAESVFDPELRPMVGTLNQGAVGGQKPPRLEIQGQARMGAPVYIDENLIPPPDHHIKKPPVRSVGIEPVGTAVRDIVETTKRRRIAHSFGYTFFHDLMETLSKTPALA
jgi:hypothetical protein